MGSFPLGGRSTPRHRSSPPPEPWRATREGTAGGTRIGRGGGRPRVGWCAVVFVRQPKVEKKYSRRDENRERRWPVGWSHLGRGAISGAAETLTYLCISHFSSKATMRSLFDEASDHDTLSFESRAHTEQMLLQGTRPRKAAAPQRKNRGNLLRAEVDILGGGRERGRWMELLSQARFGRPRAQAQACPAAAYPRPSESKLPHAAPRSLF
eukprot:scaffold17475_cov100-Isochrysis_galbana.AAC.2